MTYEVERRTFLAGTGALLYGLAPALRAQGSYPAKPIKLVVSFPAGGSADATARTVAQAISEVVGQPLVVENRAGADGLIAGDVVAKAPADGYTLLFATATGLTAAPVIHKSIPYDPIASFSPIARVGTFVQILLVHESVPVKTLTELVAYARANPGKLSYGTGTGSAIFATAQLAQLAKLDMVHVPYKGDAPLLADAIPGRVQLMFGAGGPWVPHVRSGKLRALGVLMPDRSPLLPDVPTMAEAGYPEMTIKSWAGVVGPAGLPRAIVERMNSAVLTALAKPEVRDQLHRGAFSPEGSTPEEFGTFLKDQLNVWRGVAKVAGMEPS